MATRLWQGPSGIPFTLASCPQLVPGTGVILVLPALLSLGPWGLRQPTPLLPDPGQQPGPGSGPPGEPRLVSLPWPGPQPALQVQGLRSSGSPGPFAVGGAWPEPEP